jgi:hypothetical protein
MNSDIITNYNVSSSNINIRDCVLSTPCCAAVCLESEMSGGIANVTVAFMYNCKYGGHPTGYDPTKVPDVRRIRISAKNVTGTVMGLVTDYEGLKANPLASVRFENVHFTNSSALAPSKCSEASGTYKDMTPEPALHGPWAWEISTAVRCPRAIVPIDTSWGYRPAHNSTVPL